MEAVRHLENQKNLDPRFDIIMYYKIFIKIIFILFFFQSTINASQTSHRIEYLVNDNIITNYDIAQHFALNSILENIQITSNNKDQFYEKTINDLINMKLKQIKIKEYSIQVESENMNYYENYYFQSRNLDKEKILEIIKNSELDLNVLNEIIKTNIAWEKLTSGLFYHTVAISDSEINELIKSDKSILPETAEKILINRQIKLKSDKFLRDLRAEANIEKR